MLSIDIAKYCNFGIPKLFRVFPFKHWNFWRVLCSRQDGFQDHDNARERKRLAFLKTNHMQLKQSFFKTYVC